MKTWMLTVSIVLLLAFLAGCAAEQQIVASGLASAHQYQMRIGLRNEVSEAGLFGGFVEGLSIDAPESEQYTAGVYGLYNVIPDANAPFGEFIAPDGVPMQWYIGAEAGVLEDEDVLMSLITGTRIGELILVEYHFQPAEHRGWDDLSPVDNEHLVFVGAALPTQ